MIAVLSFVIPLITQLPSPSLNALLSTLPPSVIISTVTELDGATKKQLPTVLDPGIVIVPTVGVMLINAPTELLLLSNLKNLGCDPLGNGFRAIAQVKSAWSVEHPNAKLSNALLI
jgi:hypothetical protein